MLRWEVMLLRSTTSHLCGVDVRAERGGGAMCKGNFGSELSRGREEGEEERVS